MSHQYVTSGENILDKSFKVLDLGFVRLVDYMGSDARIVQAARVSYGEGTKSVSDDEKLINYLMKNQHTSPFEMPVFLFHVKMPIFVARQWQRHRTASLNEYSGRYSVVLDDFYVPDYDRIQGQSKTNKQASEGELPSSVKGWVQHQMRHDQHYLYQTYEEMLEDGVSRELARINLPLSTYTQMYWQMDLHNLLHFLRLRMDSHAQVEIREYANVIADIVNAVCPIAWAAFHKHILGTVTISKEEYEELKSKTC